MNYHAFIKSIYKYIKYIYKLVNIFINTYLDSCVQLLYIMENILIINICQKLHCINIMLYLH